jgi:glycosyltransferase involved in cell wall biosynthesis
MEKVKILRIFHRPSVSGPTHHVAILQSYFNNDKFDSMLVCGIVLDSEESGEYLFNEKNISYKYLPFSRNLSFFNDLKSFFYLFYIVYSFRPDVIHSHASKPGVFGRLLGFIFGTKVVIHTYHGHVFHSYFGKVRSFFVIVLEWFLGFFSTSLIAISTHQAFEIQKFIGHKEKIIIVPLGLELSRFFTFEEENRSSFRKMHSLNKFTIGFSGRLEEIKDLHLFLKIAEVILLGTNFGVHFLIAGGGSMENEINSLILSNSTLKGNVVLIGWQRKIEQFYHGIDALFLTSKNEGTPVSLIEGICSGLHCFSCDVGGVKDVFINSNSGYLVPDRKPSTFSDVFLKSGIHHGFLRLNIINRKKCFEFYSNLKLTSTLENLYLSKI